MRSKKLKKFCAVSIKKIVKFVVLHSRGLLNYPDPIFARMHEKGAKLLFCLTRRKKHVAIIDTLK